MCVCHMCYMVVSPDQTVGWTQGRWPKESAEFLLHMLKNTDSNSELKGSDMAPLAAEHAQVNDAPRCTVRLQTAGAPLPQ